MENQDFTKPERLPQGVAEFHNWAESIIAKYELPANDTVKFTLATMILHAKEDAAFLPKEYFGTRALKSAANQVAAGVMQDIKAKYEAKAKEEQEAQAAAVETTATVVENECGAV